jgi:hypothetical protein
MAERGSAQGVFIVTPVPMPGGAASRDHTGRSDSGDWPSDAVTVVRKQAESHDMLSFRFDVVRLHLQRHLVSVRLQPHSIGRRPRSRMSIADLIASLTNRSVRSV